MAYDYLAEIYDQLMGHVPYDKWVEFTEKIIQKENKTVKSIVDLGCGTGEITIRLAEKGFQLTGVDLSAHMLSHAQQKSTNIKSIRWINQDVRQLNGFKHVDLFTSYIDVVNYITDETDLVEMFNIIYESLHEDGLFIFDVHNFDYAMNELVDHTFTDETEQATYIWECEAGEEDGEMIHHLTFFIKTNHYLYERFEETHYQKTLAPNIYDHLLTQAGFTEVEFYADFSDEKLKFEKNVERLFIVAKK